MPDCFQLLDSNSGKAVNLNEIDKEVCELLDVPVDEKKYGGVPSHKNSFNWFDTIGFQLSQGKTFEEIDIHYRTSKMWDDEYHVLSKIIIYLKGKYTPQSFYATRESLINVTK